MDGNYAPSPSDMRIVSSYRWYCRMLSFLGVLIFAIGLFPSKQASPIPITIEFGLLAIIAGFAFKLLSRPRPLAFWTTVLAMGIVVEDSILSIITQHYPLTLLTGLWWSGVLFYAFTPKARNALSGGGPMGGLPQKLKKLVSAAKSSFVPRLSPQPAPTS